MCPMSNRTVQLLLEDLASKVKDLGDQTLNGITSEFWHEFSCTVQTVGFSHDNKSLARRCIAALFASKVFSQVGSPTDSLLYALCASDFFDVRLFDAYTEKIVHKFIDHYTKYRAETQAYADPSTTVDVHSENLINCIFQKCTDANNYKLVLDVALKIRRMDLFYRYIKSLNNMYEVLLHTMQEIMCTCESYSFRTTVLHNLASIYQNQVEIDHVNMSKCFIFLDDPKSVIQLFRNLIENNNQKNCSIAYQIALDLYELATQRFLSNVLDSLKPKNLNAVNECSVEKSFGSNDQYIKKINNLRKIISGEMSTEKNLQFLTRNNHTNVFILKNTKEVIHSSICHTAIMIANAFTNSGTTSDQFLR